MSRRICIPGFKGEDEELEPETGVDARGVEPVIPLDEAILRSINTITNLDVRRRMQVGPRANLVKWAQELLPPTPCQSNF